MDTENEKIEKQNNETAEKETSGENIPETDSEEEYPVIHETVKKRPLKIRRFIPLVLGILAGAIVFGIVAAFVFSRFVNVFTAGNTEPVQFEQDPTPVPENTAAAGSNNLTGTETPAQEETVIPAATETETQAEPTPDPTEIVQSPTAEPTDAASPQETDDKADGKKEESDAAGDVEPNARPPVPTPMPDPVKESEERIRQNRLLYNDLRMLASSTARAIVTVTGITTTEDWFNTTSEERHQTCGVIVADNGVSYLVLAQYSGLEQCSSLYVTLFNNAIVDCSLVRDDPNTGLAVLRVQKRNIDPAVRSDIKIAVLGNSYNVGNGEPVIAVGAPMGFSGSVDYGQITSITNRISVMDAAYALIMTNIQGSSAGSGVLINLDGDVIGFIAQQYAQNTGNTITAIPISPLKRVIEILSNNQKFAYLGIIGEDVTNRLAESFGMPVGIYVTEVAVDSPAFTAGIQRGDIICRIGEDTVTEMTALGNLLNNGMANTDQSITVQRLGADGYVEIELDVHIGEI